MLNSVEQIKGFGEKYRVCTYLHVWTGAGLAGMCGGIFTIELKKESDSAALATCGKN